MTCTCIHERELVEVTFSVLRFHLVEVHAACVDTYRSSGLHSSVINPMAGDRFGQLIGSRFGHSSTRQLVAGYEMITKANFPNGLKAEYYGNKNLEGTPKVRTDENINFEPANQAPDPFLPKSPLSIRWSGDLVPSVSGNILWLLLLMTAAGYILTVRN